MVIISTIRVRGILPAGLVLNARLDTTPGSAQRINFVPVLNAGMSSLYATVPTAPVPQATPQTALFASGTFLAPFVAASLAHYIGVYGQKDFTAQEPLLLLSNALFEGDIQVATGDDLITACISRQNAFSPAWFSDFQSPAPDIVHVDFIAKLFPGRTSRLVPALDSDGVVTGAIPASYTPVGGGDAVPIYRMRSYNYSNLSWTGLRRCFFATGSPSNVAFAVELKAPSTLLSQENRAYTFVAFGAAPARAYYGITGSEPKLREVQPREIFTGNTEVAEYGEISYDVDTMLSYS